MKTTPKRNLLRPMRKKTPGLRPRKNAAVPSPFGVRLTEAMEARGITQSDLARVTFRTRQAINGWILGRTSLSTDLVAALASRLECNATWLAFGIGESGLPINSEAPVSETEASDSTR